MPASMFPETVGVELEVNTMKIKTQYDENVSKKRTSSEMSENSQQSSADSNTSKKRKLSTSAEEETNTQPRKKFKYDPNPNLQNTLIQKYIGNWKKQKKLERYVQKFLNQYSSNFTWSSRPYQQVIYKEGGKGGLAVQTNITEYGCGPSLHRHYQCWCVAEQEKQKALKDEQQRKEKEEMIKRQKQEMIQKKIAQIQQQAAMKKAGANISAPKAGSRWGS